MRQILTRVFKFLPCVVAMLLCVPVHAQDPATPPSQSLPASLGAAEDLTVVQEQPQPGQGDGKSFRQIIIEIRANEKAINRLFSSIPIGFVKEQEAHMKQIEALRASNEQLKTELANAAFIAYQVESTRSPQVAEMVFSTLVRKLNVTPQQPIFDPQGALKIANMMLESGLEGAPADGPISFVDVAYQAFLASFALQDYERASLMIDKIEARGIPLIPSLRDEVDDAKQKWQRELMIRRLESNTNDLPQVKFETTKGDFVVELFENHAPQTVGNFISLVEKKFYDDMDFFLVVPAQFARTGCPNSDGTGDAGYKIPCEVDREQIRHHFTGTLSMHNTGRDTGGSQFFITHQRIRSFDGRHTAFGRVTDGLDVVYQLQMVNESKPSRIIVEPTKIIKATVLRKRAHAYTPSRVAQTPENNGLDTTPDQSLGTVQDFSPGG